MKIAIAVAALAVASPAAAEVVSSREHGFELRYSHSVSASPAEAARAFARIGRWWDKNHTYSGNAANLTMSLQPGGCFCERLPAGGGIEHLRVTYVDPGKRIVLTGALGPLLYEAAAGTMDVQFKPAGKGSQLSVNYKVAGFANGGASKLAPLVDKVLGDLIARFAAYTKAPVPAN